MLQESKAGSRSMMAAEILVRDEREVMDLEAQALGAALKAGEDSGAMQEHAVKDISIMRREGR